MNNSLHLIRVTDDNKKRFIFPSVVYDMKVSDVPDSTSHDYFNNLQISFKYSVNLKYNSSMLFDIKAEMIEMAKYKLRDELYGDIIDKLIRIQLIAKGLGYEADEIASIIDSMFKELEVV